MSLSVAHQFRDGIPPAELIVLPEAGHLSNLERPELFNTALREFCRAHPPGEAEVSPWNEQWATSPPQQGGPREGPSPDGQTG